MKYPVVIIAAVVIVGIVAAGQSASKPKRYVISDYGAVGDGRTVNTKAIQAAIDKSSASGGGLVVIPRGTFLSGAIFLKQGVNLYVERNAILKGTTNPDDYPIIQTRWEGTEEPWTSAFVNADGLTDLEMSGEGTIDGSGDEWLRNRGSAPPQPGKRRGRPRLIGIQNSRRVRVMNLNLHNQAASATWRYGIASPIQATGRPSASRRSRAAGASSRTLPIGT